MDMAVEMSIQFNGDTLLEPDLVVFESKALLKSDANFCQFRSGGVLLAIEVASSSLSYDRRIKAPIYAHHGVREYWVVDADARLAWVHTGPSDDGWASIVEVGLDEKLTTPTLPAFSICLGAIE